MKVYVACHNPDLAEGIANKLRKRGWEITSRWHDGRPFKPTEEHTHQERMDIAMMDVDGVTAADAVVLIAGPEKYSGGKFVEAGIAIGQGKPVYVVGRRENMLLWHPLVRTFE